MHAELKLGRSQVVVNDGEIILFVDARYLESTKVTLLICSTKEGTTRQELNLNQITGIAPPAVKKKASKKKTTTKKTVKKIVSKKK